MASVLYLDTLQTMQMADALRSLAEAEAVSGFYQGEGSYLAVARKLMTAASVELEGEIASRCKGWAAVTAERERILALIRAKAEEWEAIAKGINLKETASLAEYVARLRQEAYVVRELATLIEATDA